MRKAISKACELNPYSESFNPAKYFSYTRRPESKTCLIIGEDNEAVIKLVKKAAAWHYATFLGRTVSTFTDFLRCALTLASECDTLTPSSRPQTL